MINAFGMGKAILLKQILVVFDLFLIDGRHMSEVFIHFMLLRWGGVMNRKYYLYIIKNKIDKLVKHLITDTNYVK